MEGWMVGRIEGRLGDRWRDGRIGRGIKDAQQTYERIGGRHRRTDRWMEEWTAGK